MHVIHFNFFVFEQFRYNIMFCWDTFRSVTMHDRPAKMFADLDIAGQHELFHRLDIFQYVFFRLSTRHVCDCCVSVM